MFLAAGAVSAQESAEPGDVLGKIKARMKGNLERLPDYTCHESIQRLRRAKPNQPWEKYDTLRVDVAYVGGQELHGWTGSKLGEKELRDLAGRGTVGTGAFAMHARNVFLNNETQFVEVGEVELSDGRKALRYDFEVPRQASVYKVRVAPQEAIVAFRGAFWVHPDRLDLMKLMIEVDEVPGLPVASVSDAMEYTREPIGASTFLLPSRSELTIVTSDGAENRNLTTMEGCRQYQTESKLNFELDSQTAASAAPAEAAGEAMELPKRAVIELSLETEITPESAAAGDALRAVVVKALKQGDKVLVPEGAAALGRLMRMEREAQPFPHYVMAMEFTSLEWPGGGAGLRATMEDASGPGVMRVQKVFMPSFDRRRKAGAMSILVRETQKGQGVIHWDAKQAKVKKGLRMRWEIQ